MAAPVSGMPLIWLFGMGYVCSVAIGAYAAAELLRIASGRIADDELVQVSESEEHAAGVKA
ncbi:MAG: TRAP transporter small permease, partial [Ramlibacter sp.]